MKTKTFAIAVTNVDKKRQIFEKLNARQSSDGQTMTRNETQIDSLRTELRGKFSRRAYRQTPPHSVYDKIVVWDPKKKNDHSRIETEWLIPFVA